ncbi:chloride channel protein [Ameyamaea chiangmaiensis]|uniref:Chloride channel protein n=2 Tax=Ameyamaea chiangmaiensis TaxID=442969 RepID=A0A850PDQ5_9PROT|nr:chloride channel protein [Ameyamaea chiangmaiensis]MBS4073833.1 chloride channel protein [Ameyamaea chiangmaiensis]NVN39171.1 chloride channel protein [Ameyamaea chiangmaiensis]
MRRVVADGCLWPGLRHVWQRASRWPNRVLHAPRHLRALVRADEIWLSVLAAFVGGASGLCVVAMNRSSLLLHRLLFALDNNGRLSGLEWVDPVRAVAVPAVGGVVFGLVTLALSRFVAARPVDPIEANALYGGRMAMRESAILSGQTVLSNGVGASVGLEAGYTQISSSIGSWVGQLFRTRKEDLRVLVGCGAAGAIGAAFDAPLAGAFYAFELVIGTYALVTLAPVAMASISAIGVVHLLNSASEPLVVDTPFVIPLRAYPALSALAVLCALVGIAIMYMVTVSEGAFRRSRLPVWLRPGVGGLIVGSMALITPSVLSAGHSAMRVGFDGALPTSTAAEFLVLKAIASCASIGAGFRGGLFFASLYLGSLTGAVFGGVLAMAGSSTLSVATCAVVGMGALAVAVIGGPMTMVFLTLETTGNLPLTSAVLVAAVISSLTVRRTFGYSFATWRFHLRGEAIRSAVDISWIRTLNVGRMMREPGVVLSPETTVLRARAKYPLGAVARLILADEGGRYRGLVNISDLHAAATAADAVLGDIAHHPATVLTQQMNVRDAISAFENEECDALVVVDSIQSGRVVGLLTEQHALRRYAQELDRTRRSLAGETR